jgi:uncharacterized damage-inducible protein DinB
MIADEIRRLYDYSEWATARIVEAIRNLSPEERVTELKSSYPTIRETLAHIVFAEWIWLQRCRGTSPAERPSWYASADVDELENVLRGVERERRSLLESLDDAAASSPLSYRNMAGESFHNRLSDVLLHVVNHSTYHRGQLTTMIREVGGVPPNTDLIAYVRA